MTTEFKEEREDEKMWSGKRPGLLVLDEGVMIRVHC